MGNSFQSTSRDDEEDTNFRNRHAHRIFYARELITPKAEETKFEFINEEDDDDYPIDRLSPRTDFILGSNNSESFRSSPVDSSSTISEEYKQEILRAKEAIFNKFPIPNNSETPPCMLEKEKAEKCFNQKLDVLDCRDFVSQYLQCVKKKIPGSLLA